MLMNQSDSPNDMTDLDLRKLEVRVEELIRACSLLQDENKSLRMRQENLVAERAALIEKTELARTKVEAMITRLKAMESAQ
jgi:cell division protein ZapB